MDMISGECVDITESVEVHPADSQGDRWYDRPFSLDSTNNVNNKFHDCDMLGDCPAEYDKSLSTIGPTNHHDYSHSEDADKDMQQIHRVQFNEPADYHLVTPNSEMYHDHPHRILASSNERKVNPSRAAFFTGKSSTMMKARRLLIERL